MDKEKEIKKELLSLFERMLNENKLNGAYAYLTPHGDGYKNTEYKITITKKITEL